MEIVRNKELHLLLTGSRAQVEHAPNQEEPEKTAEAFSEVLHEKQRELDQQEATT